MKPFYYVETNVLRLIQRWCYPQTIRLYIYIYIYIMGFGLKKIWYAIKHNQTNSITVMLVFLLCRFWAFPYYVISFLSQYNTHLIFCCILSMFALHFVLRLKEDYFLFWYFSFFYPGQGGLTQESEWQQVSSGFQDSVEYSCRSQQCCGLYGLDSSSDFQYHEFFFSRP